MQTEENQLPVQDAQQKRKTQILAEHASPVAKIYVIGQIALQLLHLFLK
jgi:hypothetical protein